MFPPPSWAGGGALGSHCTPYGSKSVVVSRNGAALLTQEHDRCPVQDRLVDGRIHAILWDVHGETRANPRALKTHGDDLDHQHDRFCLDVSDDLAETIRDSFGQQMRGGPHVQADLKQST